MHLGTLLEKYDRVLSIDSDVLLNPECPDPFEFVEPEDVGTVFEDVGSRQASRRNVIQVAQVCFADIGWVHGYMNTGFAMFSSCHKDIFQPIRDRLWDGWGYDDVHLMYQVKSKGMRVGRLPWEWNCMTMFCEKWNDSPSRFDAWVIHYAGQGRFIDKCKTRQAQIEHDVAKWYPGGV